MIVAPLIAQRACPVRQQQPPVATRGTVGRPAFSWLPLLLAALTASTVLSDQTAPAPAAAGKASSEGPEFSAEQIAFFRDKVQPLIQARCAECHGQDSKARGGLQIVSRASILQGGDSGPAIVPFEPHNSLMLAAVRYESFQMPPRTRLPEGEVNILERWIALGAPWPEDATVREAAAPEPEFPLAERREAHWVWRPVTRPPVPNVRDVSWPDGATDRFILAKLEEQGLTPTPDADRRTILRRLYFDLTGLPPGVDEQQRFLDDPEETPRAMEKVVDELLTSPYFGERWARHWLDLVRYAETLGHEFDYPLPHAWKYRDYVIRAFCADVPYDQFLREQISGDLLPEPRRHPTEGFNESIIGTGFWYLGEDKHSPVDVRGEEASRFDNQIDVFSKAFLGLTVACARCHDHKFDAISSRDYYALVGFLQSSRRRLDWLDENQESQQWLARLQQLRRDNEAILQHDLESLTADRVAERVVEAICRSEDAPEGAQEDSDAFSRMLRQADTSRPTHPLSLAAVLSGMPSTERDSGAALAESVSRWANAVLAQAAAEEPGKLFARFADSATAGLPPGWLFYGSAAEGWTSGRDTETVPAAGAGSAQFDRARMHWSPAEPGPAPPGSVSSATLTGGARGVLQSPTFTLEHPEILVLAAGEAARMRLVIDGYVMSEFSDLLFRGVRQPIDTNGEFRWLRLAGDLHRYQGHRCHLEFLDEGNGWFAVQEVRFVPQSGDPAPAGFPPSQSLSQLARDLLSQPPQALKDVAASLAKALIRDPAWPVLAGQLELLHSLKSERGVALRQRWSTEAAAAPAVVPVLVMSDGTPEDEHVFVRGNHRNPGEVVPRRFLEAIVGQQARPVTAGSGRLLLAEQVVSPENPLTARVAVNRVWQHLFSRGIVASPDNFGVLGERPTHPELLDYLAVQFIQDGWSVRRLIRSLVLSRTYRMSSQRNADAELVDPGNSLLHRSPVRRLEGEALRDAMLAVSGQLQPAQFGEPVPVHLTPFMQGRGRPKDSGPLNGDGRRSIYLAVHRNFLSPWMLAFDTPVPATTVGQRSSSNVPAQALILLNNEFVAQQAGAWADRLAAQEYSDSDSLIQAAFRQSLSRPATETELRIMRTFCEQLQATHEISGDELPRHRPAIAEICHVLLNQKEFLFLN